jgi:hypothetical protein
MNEYLKIAVVTLVVLAVVSRVSALKSVVMGA